MKVYIRSNTAFKYLHNINHIISSSKKYFCPWITQSHKKIIVGNLKHKTHTDTCIPSQKNIQSQNSYWIAEQTQLNYALFIFQSLIKGKDDFYQNQLRGREKSKKLVVFITAVFTALLFYLRQDFYTPTISFSYFLYYDSTRNIVSQ